MQMNPGIVTNACWYQIVPLLRQTRHVYFKIKAMLTVPKTSGLAHISRWCFPSFDISLQTVWLSFHLAANINYESVFSKKKKKEKNQLHVWDVDFECLPLRGEPSHTFFFFLDSISVLLMFFLTGWRRRGVSEDFWFWFAIIDATEGQRIGKHTPLIGNVSPEMAALWLALVRCGVISSTVLKGSLMEKSAEIKEAICRQKNALLSWNVEFCGVKPVQNAAGVRAYPPCLRVFCQNKPQAQKEAPGTWEFRTERVKRQLTESRRSAGTFSLNATLLTQRPFQPVSLSQGRNLEQDQASEGGGEGVGGTPPAPAEELGEGGEQEYTHTSAGCWRFHAISCEWERSTVSTGESRGCISLERCCKKTEFRRHRLESSKRVSKAPGNKFVAVNTLRRHLTELRGGACAFLFLN